MKLFFTLTILLFAVTSFSQVGIGTPVPHSSAQLDVTSTTKGFLLPRMTTGQRDAIQNPAMGLMLFNTTTNKLEVFTGVWTPVNPASSGNQRKLLGGSGNDYAFQARPTSDGGYVIAGYSNSTNISGVTNNGATDYYVIKLDATMNVQWQKMYGTAGDEGGHIPFTFEPYVFDFETTADGGYVLAGRSGGSAYILKLDNSGAIQWTKSHGISGWEVEAHSIQQTSDGGYIVSGEAVVSPLAGTDYYIVKLDGSGNAQWTQRLGDPNDMNDKAYSICQTTDGNYIVAGLTRSSVFNNIIKLSSTGTIIWDKKILGNDVIFTVEPTTDGGCAILNSTTAGSSGGYDLQLIKMDVSGNIQWQNKYGGNGNDLGYSVQQTTDGGYILGGTSASTNLSGVSSNGGTDMYVVKVDSGGTMLWQNLLGGSGTDDGRSIRQTTDGGYIICGWTNSSIPGTTGNGGVDYLVMKLGVNGSPL